MACVFYFTLCHIPSTGSHVLTVSCSGFPESQCPNMQSSSCYMWFQLLLCDWSRNVFGRKGVMFLLQLNVTLMTGGCARPEAWCCTWPWAVPASLSGWTPPASCSTCPGDVRSRLGALGAVIRAPLALGGRLSVPLLQKITRVSSETLYLWIPVT